MTKGKIWKIKGLGDVSWKKKSFTVVDKRLQRQTFYLWNNIHRMNHFQWDQEFLQDLFLFLFDINHNQEWDNEDTCFDLWHKEQKTSVGRKRGQTPTSAMGAFSWHWLCPIVWVVASCLGAICSWISNVSAWCSAAPTLSCHIRPFDR